MNFKHLCHATGCTNEIKKELLMCERHWAMVPSEMKNDIVTNFNPLQCDKKMRPSIAWLKAARKAINYVKIQETYNRGQRSQRFS